MRSTKQTRFFVLVRDGTHVPAHNFEICILAGVVDCHLEHAEVEVGDRAERPACDQYDGLLFWMALKEVEAVVRKGIVRRCGETPSRTSNVLLRIFGHEGYGRPWWCEYEPDKYEISGIGDPSEPDMCRTRMMDQSHRNRFPRSHLLGGFTVLWAWLVVTGLALPYSFVLTQKPALHCTSGHLLIECSRTIPCFDPHQPRLSMLPRDGAMTGRRKCAADRCVH
jgi:hypothetical protein